MGEAKRTRRLTLRVTGAILIIVGGGLFVTNYLTVLGKVYRLSTDSFIAAESVCGDRLPEEVLALADSRERRECLDEVMSTPSFQVALPETARVVAGGVVGVAGLFASALSRAKLSRVLSAPTRPGTWYALLVLSWTNLLVWLLWIPFYDREDPAGGTIALAVSGLAVVLVALQWWRSVAKSTDERGGWQQISRAAAAVLLAAGILTAVFLTLGGIYGVEFVADSAVTFVTVPAAALAVTAWWSRRRFSEKYPPAGE